MRSFFKNLDSEWYFLVLIVICGFIEWRVILYHSSLISMGPKYSLFYLFAGFVIGFPLIFLNKSLDETIGPLGKGVIYIFSIAFIMTTILHTVIGNLIIPLSETQRQEIERECDDFSAKPLCEKIYIGSDYNASTWDYIKFKEDIDFENIL